jgi:integrase/recombinase XerD
MARSVLPIEVEEFLSWMVAEKGRSANTIAAYRRDLRAYCEWLTSHGATVSDVTHRQLVEFVGVRRASGAATSSIARQLAAVRMLHRHLSIEGSDGTIPQPTSKGSASRRGSRNRSPRNR